MWVNERPQHVLTGRQRHDGLAVRQVLLYRLYDRGGIENPTLHAPDFADRVARLVLDRLVPGHPTYPRHRSTVNISRVAPGLAQDEIRLSNDVGLRSAVLWSHGSVALWCIPQGPHFCRFDPIRYPALVSITLYSPAKKNQILRKLFFFCHPSVFLFSSYDLPTLTED